MGLLAGCPRPPAKLTPTVSNSRVNSFREEGAARGISFHQVSGKSETLDIVLTSAGGCGVLDYDGDGWLDIFLVQGQHRDAPGGGNALYRNRGDGTFEDVTEKAGVRGKGYGIGCASGDFNADGRPDLFVCNYGQSELYQNRGDGTFEAVGERLGAAVTGFSVGAVFADFTGDGWPDLYVARYVRLRPDSPRVCSQSGIPASCGPTIYDLEPGVLLRN